MPMQACQCNKTISSKLSVNSLINKAVKRGFWFHTGLDAVAGLTILFAFLAKSLRTQFTLSEKGPDSGKGVHTLECLGNRSK